MRSCVTRFYKTPQVMMKIRELRTYRILIIIIILFSRHKNNGIYLSLLVLSSLTFTYSSRKVLTIKLSCMHKNYTLSLNKINI